MSDYRGRFVWHELLTTDPKSAGAFFSKIIGWKTQPWDEGRYTLFVSGKRQDAGLMAVPEDVKQMGGAPSWLTYIGTHNVDETARLATSLGAVVKKGPEDIPHVGRYAVLQDPQGAVFGIYKSNEAPGRDGAAPELGQFSWHELATTDAKAGFDFYRKLFGWVETSAMDMGPMGVYRMFGQSKDRPMGGFFNKPNEMPGPPSWLPYIRISDAKKSAAAVTKAGAKVINGPMEVPGGDWIAQGLDPQGVMFALHSLAAAPPAAAPPTSSTKPATKKRVSSKRASAAKKQKTARKAAKKGKAAKAKSPRKAANKSSSKGKKKASRR
jgi:uncharacterized protein